MSKITIAPNWPLDSDGDVLRRLVNGGFDFSRPHEVDFNIDFQAWPPPVEALQFLGSKYPGVEIHDKGHYVQLKIEACVTYDFVVQTQAVLSEQMKPFGGTCESWGVFHN